MCIYNNSLLVILWLGILLSMCYTMLSSWNYEINLYQYMWKLHCQIIQLMDKKH